MNVQTDAQTESARLDARIAAALRALDGLPDPGVEERILSANLADLNRLIDSWLAVANDVHTGPHERASAELHLIRLRRYADRCRAQLARLREIAADD